MTNRYGEFRTATRGAQYLTARWQPDWNNPRVTAVTASFAMLTIAVVVALMGAT